MARRLRQLGPRHLERTVAAQDDRPLAGADLDAERARNPEPHRRVVALRQVAAAALDAHVETSEEHVAGLGDHREAALAGEETVQLTQHVGNGNDVTRRSRDGTEVVGIAHPLVVAAQALTP